MAQSSQADSTEGFDEFSGSRRRGGGIYRKGNQKASTSEVARV